MKNVVKFVCVLWLCLLFCYNLFVSLSENQLVCYVWSSIILDLSIKHFHGRPFHIDMIVCLFPLYVERSSVHYDVQPSFVVFFKYGGYGCSASSCAACLTPFPIHASLCCRFGGSAQIQCLPSSGIKDGSPTMGLSVRDSHYICHL